MSHMKASILAVILIAMTPSLSSQQHITPSFEKSIPPQNTLPTVGKVVEGTYKNPSIGIELTPAENLHLEDPEMKGTPGTTPLLIVISASESGLLKGLLSPRSVMIFDADALAYYPADQRTVDRYIKKVIRANEADGYKTINPGASAQFSGIPVERAEFLKGEVHEAVLITIHNGYAFVFIFAGADFESINKSIAATKVKLAAAAPD